ncbi:hypothetical protein Anas_04498 [Armadillidium nasatum]|uniref:Small VCP/p97-interacting protein n=1 Tax=Armadillidium nasatum TaxID=96803 RepID=A0A5N5SLB8_9CRUS|nr:hypothetical protein Anas_04498 [Armadillidium nasatum]
MGICSSCFGEPSTYETPKSANYVKQPDPEERRQQMLEAAERRKREQESKGLQNPERVKAKQRRMEELEKKQEEMEGYQNQGGGGGLKWQVN